MDQKNCKDCFHADRCRQVWSESPGGTFSPAGLSLASLVAFLLPLVTAIVAGAAAHIYLIDQDNAPMAEIAAALAGLLAGAALAWLFMPSLKKHFDESKK